MSHFDITVTGLTPLEAAKHLVDLITSGQLDDELKNDPQCIIDCIYVIERMFLTRQPGPFGAAVGTSENEESQVISELGRILSAAPRAIPAWIIQIAIQAFLAWLQRQQNNRAAA